MMLSKKSLKAEDPASSDALEDSQRKDDGVAEKSDYSLNQVSEKVNPVVGFQLTCESVSTDSVSIIEENENELKDSLNAYNVNLESEVVKHRNLQESSGYVPQQSGDSISVSGNFFQLFKRVKSETFLQCVARGIRVQLQKLSS
jgi:hypothetical protein